MSIEEGKKSSKINIFWLKYGDKIILTFGIILIAAVSFEAGLLHGKKSEQESVIVNKVACTPCAEETETANTAESSTNKTNGNISPAATRTAEAPTTENKNCAFVASKNSDKYHLATCQWASRIKPENKVCFSSAEEATSRGFQGAKCCIK